MICATLILLSDSMSVHFFISSVVCCSDAVYSKYEEQRIKILFKINLDSTLSEITALNIKYSTCWYRQKPEKVIMYNNIPVLGHRRQKCIVQRFYLYFWVMVIIFLILQFLHCTERQIYAWIEHKVLSLCIKL